MKTKDIHSAEKPIQLSWEGWKQIGKRVNSELTIDHIAIVSAGVAFYFFAFSHTRSSYINLWLSHGTGTDSTAN